VLKELQEIKFIIGAEGKVTTSSFFAIFIMASATQYGGLKLSSMATIKEDYVMDHMKKNYTVGETMEDTVAPIKHVT
jgi:hypothetical protein